MTSDFGKPVREFQFYLVTDQMNQTEGNLVDWQEKFKEVGAELYYSSLSLQKGVLYIRVIEKGRLASQAINEAIKQVDKVPNLRVFWVVESVQDLDEITNRISTENLQSDIIDLGFKLPSLNRQKDCSALVDELLEEGKSLADALEVFKEHGCVISSNPVPKYEQ